MDSPDEQPPGPRGWGRALSAGLGAGAVLAGVGVVGREAVRVRDRHRQDAAVGRLSEKVLTQNQPLSAAEFADLLTLCEAAADPERRQSALAVAMVAAERQKDAGWGPRVAATADRLLDDPRPGTRRNAVGAVGRFGGPDHLARVKPLLADPDPAVRAAAAGAVTKLEARAAEPRR